jgi:CheY-like chemotaxis protein
MTVLYAEDDIDDYSFFVETLHELIPGVECINAINGLNALELLEDLPVKPDVIFLDINMPAMDGKACLKTLKNDLRFRSIPVFIYTTGANPMDIAHCKQLGAKDYIQKPNSITEARRILGGIFASVASQ